ncbi:MAG: hypothetical protein ACI837_002334 [Crocinitomicaceae bacterium]|jgi:hypothetical protein
MKSIKFSAFLICALSTLTSNAQIPDNVQGIDAVPNEITSYTGNLSNGEIMEDLSWASSGSNACFPGTQNAKFRGNHVLHQFDIPEYSEVTITVIPKDKNADFSLYGYQVGTTNFRTPPNLPSCVSCEADHKWDYKKRGKTQDHTRSIRFNSTTNSYNIFIGVVGANPSVVGEYTLEIDLVSRVLNTEEQKALTIYSVTAEKGKTTSYTGDLKDGCKIHDLSFASYSSVACFPGTQNLKFTGNHVFYTTQIPDHAIMEITVIPDNKNDNFSIYAYQDGTTSTVFPPELSSCVSCEAEHKWDYKKRGKTQDHTRTVSLNAIANPYRVVIGIVGADGLTEGGFKLEIKMVARN